MTLTSRLNLTRSLAAASVAVAILSAGSVPAAHAAKTTGTTTDTTTETITVIKDTKTAGTGRKIG